MLEAVTWRDRTSGGGGAAAASVVTYPSIETVASLQRIVIAGSTYCVTKKKQRNEKRVSYCSVLHCIVEK
jgi:hypothetical protein